jgi:prepilin-type N-terminal cleavage/methylation domain-containing protein
MRRGFTLIELLLVMGIISILALIVIVSVNPTKQLGQARNEERRAGANAILNAVYQYMLDYDQSPVDVPIGIPMEICKVSSDPTQCNNGVDLDVLTGSYLTDIPVDPQEPLNSTGTNFWIKKTVTDLRITVIASGAELGQRIQVVR